uniref:Uncharacterized protein n=1 Tax=Rhizophora mucronata TaxID=61149 RepID=A0A2P2P7I9_RHIMU
MAFVWPFNLPKQKWPYITKLPW